MGTRTAVRAALAAAALAAAALSAAPAAAAGLPDAESAAEEALQRGYGQTCSLDFRPAAADGYWPCVDFGPYRFVRAYGQSHFAVVQEGRDPFIVATGPHGALRWLHDGPWTADLPGRILTWRDDVIGGRAAARDMQQSRSEAMEAAASYIRSLDGSGEDEAPPLQAPEDPPSPPAAERMTPDVRDLLSRGQ